MSIRPFFCRTFIGLTLMLVAFPALYAQSAPGEPVPPMVKMNRPNGPDANCLNFKLETEVPLSNVGIAHWDFLNPRRPYPLVRGKDRRSAKPTAGEFADCLAQAKVRFSNVTSDRTIVVTVPFSFPIPEVALSNLFAGMKTKATIWKIADDITKGKRPSSASFLLPNTGVEAQASDEQQAEAKKKAEERKAALENWLRDDDRAQKMGLPHHPEDRLQVEAELAKANAELGSLAGAEDEARLMTTLEAGSSALAAELAMHLDGNPAALKSTLNRLSGGVDTSDPAWQKAHDTLFGPRGQRCEDRLKLLAKPFAATDLDAFKTECVDVLRDELNRGPLTKDLEALTRKFQEVLALFEEIADNIAVGARAGQATAPKSLQGLCKEDTVAFNCSKSLTVSPGSTAWLDGGKLGSGLVVFKVRFFSEADIPTFDTGYLQTAAEFAEQPNSTQWQFSGAVGLSYDPDTAFSPPAKAFNHKRFLAGEQSYQGNQRKRFPGSGNLKLAQKLGNRAEGSATLQFKKGDLGGPDGSTNAASVPDYKLTLFGDNGAQLIFGKYLMANPQDGLAVAAQGEGVELRYRWLSLGHIVRRESADGTPNDRNQDNRLTLLRFNALPFEHNPFIRSVNLLLLDGKEGNSVVKVDCNQKLEEGIFTCDRPPEGTPPGTPPGETQSNKVGAYEFRTYGAEAFFADPRTRFTGSLAHYRSQKKVVSAADTLYARQIIREGKGDATMLRGAWTFSFLPSGEAAQVLQVLVGYGSGDNPATPERDEGYLGETAGFSAGQIFLPRFGNEIGTKTRIDVAGGMSNKIYTGVTYTNNTSALPLEGLVRLLRIEEPITSKATIFRLHNIRFNEPVLGSREAGSELEVEFQVQVPKGVFGSVSIARFFAGDALKDVFKEEPWAFSASVKVTM